MKLPKSTIKHLKDIANKLPVMYTSDGQKTLEVVTGESLLLNGVNKLSNGDDVTIDKSYATTREGGVQVNHFKRMKRLAEIGNIEAVKRYISSVFEINRSHSDVIKSFNDRIGNVQL